MKKKQTIRLSLMSLSLYCMVKLAVGPRKCKLQQLLAALDLFNKVKGANSRITPDAAKDRW